MASKSLLRPRALCALDFGTSFSGFAFTAVSDGENKIFQWYDWPSQTEGGGLPYCKTRTELLLDGGSGDVLAWGWPAFVQRWSAPPASAREEANQPIFASRFKLLLAPDAENTELEGLSVREMVSKYLLKLGGVALEHIRLQLGNHIRPSDVQWCLTVPAVWDEAAKATMRDAMADAGLVAYRDSAPHASDASAHKLLMVLEPEAASLYCHHKLNNNALWASSAGSNVMCVDCGGGTTDIVVHCEEEREDGSLSLREVVKGSGACVGGTTVDAAFLKLLSEIVPVFDEYAAKHPKEVLRSLMQKFELAKRSFDGSNAIDLDLPPKLARLAYEYKCANYEDCGANDSDDEDDYGTLTLTVDKLIRIFDEAVNPIVNLITEQLDATPGGCHDMLVVGGFAASPYLMQRLKLAFSSRVSNIVQPPQSGSAIVEGAVLYGLRPESVHARCARKTYGIQMCRPWIPAYEGICSARKFNHVESGLPYAGDIFDTFVTAGDQVPVGKTVKKIVHPMYKTTREVSIPVFSAPRGHPLSCYEKGVKFESEFIIGVPEYTGVVREVEVSMKFGDTMIEVTAVDKTTGAEQSVSVTFAKQYK